MRPFSLGSFSKYLSLERGDSAVRSAELASAGPSEARTQATGVAALLQWPRTPRRAVAGVVSLVLFTAGAFLSSAQAQAAPPTVSSTAASAVTGTSATLGASIDPLGANVKDAHFEYLLLAVYEKGGGTFGAATQKTAKTNIHFDVEGSGQLTVSSALVTGVKAVKGAFGPGQAIEGTGIPPSTTITEVGAGTLRLSHPATAAGTVELTATGPQPFSATLSGLLPGSGYVFRAFAESASGEVARGPATTFYTQSLPPLFGPCPNEAFRSGELAPPGHPSALLPDCRAYEQASPVDKSGNDAIGEIGFSHAAADGLAATFLTTSGVPGGEGAQEFPNYLASRGDEAWSTTGLEPQASAGPRAHVLGWTPDFTETVTEAVRQSGTTLEGALYVRTSPGAPAIQASAYVPFVGSVAYSYAGASADGRTIVFEVPRALPPREGEPPIPGARPDTSEVYAYDTATGLVSLVSTLNSEALPKGAFAGPYDWAKGRTDRGGAATSAYTTDQRAVAADGSVFFTASGSGRLYERLNPTEPQSPTDGAGTCTDPALACTIAVSATEKTNGTGGGPDPAGPQAAAFQAAAADGSQVFFTSSEKLTNDANTGPEQPPAQIGRATLTDPDPDATKEESFIPEHALGVAVDPKGEFIYWVEPLKGTIARADLTAPVPKDTVEDEYIDTGVTEFEAHPVSAPGVLDSAHSTPRYVAVDEHHVYWTNTGPLGEGGTIGVDTPVPGAGTIGRATIAATGAGQHVEPEFITGASDPQGIAVDGGHIYWANRKEMPGNITPAVGRATLEGEEAKAVNQAFYRPGGSHVPYGVAVSATHLYVTVNSGSSEDQGALVIGLPLSGGPEEIVQVLGLQSRLRGIAVAGEYVYWAAKGTEVLGRVPIDDFAGAFNCEVSPVCEEEFLPLSGAPDGLASDATHLYWSLNGESQPNPGNDLYRWSATAGPGGHHLTDLTSDPTGDGAEVVGVLGTTPDGSYTYFLADGDLDGSGPGFQGTCHGSQLQNVTGRCAIYLEHGGQTSFVAPLRLGGSNAVNDVTDVIPRGIDLLDTGVVEKTSYLAPDGTLVFRSVEEQPPYRTGGVSEFYRFVPGHGLACLTCDPGGGPSAPASTEVDIGTPGLSSIKPALTMPRALSTGGGRFFFQTTGALVAADTDGQAGCPFGTGSERSAPSCQDVYEWEAPGTGSCVEGQAGYSPLDHGCLYLLSPGDDTGPAFFSDASADGSVAFLYTRDQLVGQDQDGLIDLYAVRVDGGLASQEPRTPPGCEGEGCRPATTPAPSTPSPQTPGFLGPGNAHPPGCPKGKVLRKGRCQRPKRHHKKHHGHHKKNTHPGQSKGAH